ncbi:MAG: hypothetical protein M1823_007805, partial [Watsoniomyces obsoletus]
MAVIFHPKRELVAVHGSEKAIELLRIRSEAEVRKAMTRKRKRRRDKTGADSAQIEEEAQYDNMDISTTPITEVIVPYNILRTGGKVRSIDWAGGKSG